MSTTEPGAAVSGEGWDAGGSGERCTCARGQQQVCSLPHWRSETEIWYLQHVSAMPTDNLLKKWFVASVCPELLPYQVLTAKKQLHTLSVTGASFECFPLSCLESLSTKGTSSTPSNIILFHKIHALQRSSLTFDVTVCFVARNALSVVEGLFCTHDCVVLVGVCTVLSLNSNRVKCL